MLRHIRLFVGISIFWLALSILTDGVNTLLLPLRLGRLTGPDNQATTLGLLTFVGLLAGALVQPVAGALSDRLHPYMGRNRFIGIGMVLSLASLFFFAVFQNMLGILAGYLAIQISASIAQAGQQALIPDLVDEGRRGLASGLKGFMDLTGAMLGFVLLGELLGSRQSLLAIWGIAAVLAITYIIAILLTPEDRQTKPGAIKTEHISLREIFRIDLKRHTGFIRLLVARFLFLLGVYAVGRFLLLFVGERLDLTVEQAAEQAGYLLAGLALVTILAAPIAGWLADRVGRAPLMIAGAALSAAGALMLIWAGSAGQILLFGGFMSLGSAAFAGGSWAALADLVPKDQAARFFGLANFSVAGSAAVAGLFGPVIDWTERIFPQHGFSALFILASLAFVASAMPCIKGIREIGEKYGNKRKDCTDAPGLAVVSLPADPAIAEENQNS